MVKTGNQNLYGLPRVVVVVVVILPLKNIYKHEKMCIPITALDPIEIQVLVL